MSVPATNQSAPARLLIAGFGKLGARLAERYSARGTQVFGVRRGEVDGGPGVKLLRANLADPELPPLALPGVDALVVTLPPPVIDGEIAPAGYLRSLENLAAGLPSIPGRVVFVSSTRVFEGRGDGTEISEADAPAPTSVRARSLVNGERSAVDLLGASIVRPAGIYGPGRDRLIQRVLAGDPIQYTRRTNRVHESDLVRAIEAMLDRADAPALLHATDAGPAPLGDVTIFVAKQLGVPAPPRIHPEKPSGTLLSGKRMHALLGSLEYPSYRDGYAEIIRERGQY